MWVCAEDMHYDMQVGDTLQKNNLSSLMLQWKDCKTGAQRGEREAA